MHVPAVMASPLLRVLTAHVAPHCPHASVPIKGFLFASCPTHHQPVVCFGKPPSYVPPLFFATPPVPSPLTPSPSMCAGPKEPSCLGEAHVATPTTVSVPPPEWRRVAARSVLLGEPPSLSSFLSNGVLLMHSLSCKTKPSTSSSLPSTSMAVMYRCRW
jgi:hypothetical protein